VQGRIGPGLTGPKLSGIDHLVLTVRDMAATLAFWEGVLGVPVERFQGADGAERLALRIGEQKINLHVAGAEVSPHAAAPMPGSADLCLLTADPPEAWMAHLAAAGVAVEIGPVPRTGARWPILSIYVRDPDGNLVEIAARARG
jgi:catechol 2,3-dioxygenase-like lactoylglutathione lyase family enzyme